MKIDDALIFVLRAMVGKNEMSPQMIFYSTKGELALVQIHSSLRLLAEGKSVDIRNGDNRFYKLNTKGLKRLKEFDLGNIAQML